MLLTTTVNSVEDTAKTMGIDLTKKDFWRLVRACKRAGRRIPRINSEYVKF
ncbi:MAG: hypothetical protein IJK13_00915 [Lachnospiraceae bacterium]|nr:hypothetical protein [Lachnospiraceae bacterium]